LFNCDEKKAQWYVRRGFATLVQAEPNIVV